MNSADDAPLHTSLHDALSSELDEICCNVDPPTLSRYALGPFAPQIVVSPTTILELAMVLKIANQRQASVLLWGAGTTIGLGNPPKSIDMVVELSRLDSLVAHDIDNFSVTVQAGMKLAKLQEMIGKHNQFLPLDPPVANEATVGGIVAANLTGPWRLAYGSVRDLVLGLKVVLADGRLVSFGGKTMKNVAGYDAQKLFIGSLGTLGAISEVTFRLYSKPEAAQTVLLPATSAKMAFALAHQSFTLFPSAVQVLDPVAATSLATNSSWLVVVDCMGDCAVVEKQCQEMQKDHSEAKFLTGNERSNALDTLRDIMKAPQKDDILCKINLPPAEVEEFINNREEIQKSGGYSIACPGTGRVWLCASFQNESIAVECVRALRTKAEQLSGSLCVSFAPDEWKPALDVWGTPPAHVNLLKEIKKLFDPNNILSPGRYVGGI